MKKLFRVFLLGFLVLFVLAGCAAPTEEATEAPEPTEEMAEPTEPPQEEATEAPEPMEQPVLKLGAAVSLTGALANQGSDLKDGYEYWKETVNEMGGIEIGDQKYEVEIVYYDDTTDAETSVKLTEKLITEDEVDFLLGPFGSGITNATSAVGEKYQVLTFASMANANSIYEREFDYTFGILPLAGSQAKPALEMAAAMGETTVAIVTPDDLWPRTVAEGAQDLAENLGMEVVYFEAYPKGASDLSTMINQMKALEPGVLVGTGYEAELILMTRQMKELQFNANVVVFSGATTYLDYIESLSTDTHGVMGLDWWTAAASWEGGIFGSAQEYAEGFEAEYGYEPRYISGAASAAGEVLRLALENAGTTDTEAVRQALLDLDTQIFFGNYNFNEHGVNVGGSAMGTQIIWEDADNYDLFIVWPEEIQERAPVYPKPFWGEMEME